MRTILISILAILVWPYAIRAQVNPPQRVLATPANAELNKPQQQKIQVFKHSVVLEKNTNGPNTTLENTNLNGNQGAILIVTPNSANASNPNPVGVGYVGQKWVISNLNGANMPAKMEFNVLYAQAAGENVFVHTANANNITRENPHITTLNHHQLNGKPNARILVTQRVVNRVQSNSHPVAVRYVGGLWQIFNIDRSPIPLNSQFNICLDERTELIKITAPRGNQGPIGSASTKGKQNNLVFITPNWEANNPVSQLPVAVKYIADDWTVVNPNTSSMPSGAGFHVLSVAPALGRMVYRMELNREQFNKPGTGTTTGKQDSTTAVSSTLEDLERKGPKNVNDYEWRNYIGTDYPFDAAYPLINLYNKFYGDANPQSGYFYCLPNSYNLNWSSASGYSLYIKYLSSNAGEKGMATVTAELTPNIFYNDRTMAEKLLKAILKKHPARPFVDLTSPSLSEPPRVSIEGISEIGIDPKDIHVTTPSNLAEPITISWTMQSVEFLMIALFQNVGLSGNLILKPDGDDMSEQSVPFNIKLNDPGTFGKFELDPATWRSTPWVNFTPYPVILKNFHILKSNRSGSPAFSVYTWQAGNMEVPPGSQVQFDAATVPAWVDNHPSIQRIWLEYEIGACHSCDEGIENDLIGGTKGTRSRQIAFDVFDPISYTGAKMIKIKVRALQADPNTRTKMDLPTLSITADDTTLNGGTIYVPEGSKPEFEFYLQIIMPDGTIYESDFWELSNDPDTNIIGQAMIRRMVSSFKK
jgi:hypothetical protein